MKPADAYYTIKPLLPRRLQIRLRQWMCARLRARVNGNWPIEEAAGEAPPDWRGWPDGKDFGVVLTHDVESARGRDRCLEVADLEAAYGFRSGFAFVPERYTVSASLRFALADRGCEVAVHGLRHDGRLFRSRRIFQERAPKINRYLEEWEAVGFRAPSMIRIMDWLHALQIEYDASSFDTDPFEPVPANVGTIFPFPVRRTGSDGFWVLPYTLPQDLTLFVLLGEPSIDIWKQKLAWIARKGGMALMLTHPDYMHLQGRRRCDEYPIRRYEEFLAHLRDAYPGRFWHGLPREVVEASHG